MTKKEIKKLAIQRINEGKTRQETFEDVGFPKSWPFKIREKGNKYLI